jgi:septum formation protein
MALILASSSPIRRAMLDAAGIPYEPIPTGVDEAAFKKRLGSAEEIAVELAVAKAVDVSAARPNDWVIGSDSMVSIEGRLFDKPRDREEAADHLRFFSGKVMRLTSAACLAFAGRPDWSHSETAELHVRQLSESFIENYLDADWPEVGYCVGVFRLEGPGVQLFECVQGDHFTIMGMPLIPLLAALRKRGILPR